MTLEDEKRVIADKVIEYSDASKRLIALQAEARTITKGLQTIEFAFSAATSISDSDKTNVLEAIQAMPTAEKLKEILHEIDEKLTVQVECEATLKSYGMKLPVIL